MRDHNICFYAELIKVISYYDQILPLVESSKYRLTNSGVPLMKMPYWCPNHCDVVMHHNRFSHDEGHLNCIVI